MPTNSMREDDKLRIAEVIESEGFEYAFIDYTDFEDVKDKTFHKLRKAYINAHNALENYIEPMGDPD